MLVSSAVSSRTRAPKSVGKEKGDLGRLDPINGQILDIPPSKIDARRCFLFGGVVMGAGSREKPVDSDLKVY
jgi:hypothetical protein